MGRCGCAPIRLTLRRPCFCRRCKASWNSMTTSRHLMKQAQRFREIGLIPRSDLPRYAWRLQSKLGVDTEEFDPMEHVSWLLGQVRPGVCLGQLLGMETLLSFFWGGPGRGGGPFISTALAGLLVQHQIALDMGFYVEADA